MTLVNVHAKYEWSAAQLDKWAEPILAIKESVLALGDWNERPDQGPVGQWPLVDLVRCTDKQKTWSQSTVQGTGTHFDYGLLK